MKNPNIKTEVVHSLSKSAWNVISTKVGQTYKIARIPYLLYDDKILSTRNKAEALERANFISYCFNNSNEILRKIDFFINLEA